MSINFDTYYPQHASRPVDPLYSEHIAIWDNVEGEALEAWRRWFEDSGCAEAWAKVDCIECELGRTCLKVPPCEGAE